MVDRPSSVVAMSPTDFPIPVPDGGTVVLCSARRMPEDQSSHITYPVSEYDSLVATYQSFVDGIGGDVTTFNTDKPRSQSPGLVSTETESYNISVTESGPGRNGVPGGQFNRLISAPEHVGRNRVLLLVSGRSSPDRYWSGKSKSA